jgi:hypothetical protein
MPPPLPRRIRLVYVFMSLVFVFLAAAPIYRELTRSKDIWWTPRTMMVPLAQSGDRVEIYVAGKPLGDVLQAGEVGLRFNNWDRVRAERFPMLLVNAAVCGALVTVLLLMVTGRLTYREEKQQGTA